MGGAVLLRAVLLRADVLAVTLLMLWAGPAAAALDTLEFHWPAPMRLHIKKTVKRQETTAGKMQDPNEQILTCVMTFTKEGDQFRVSYTDHDTPGASSEDREFLTALSPDV